jgi:hypothetical protein
VRNGTGFVMMLFKGEFGRRGMLGVRKGGKEGRGFEGS